tara:strand:- start:44781 stop:45173 length:393 start_codon:yes stop_codon:yes gene_type:complete
MIKTFNKTIQVVAEDLDDLNHVNNVRYVQWIQDIAKEHWQQKAPKEMLDNSIWVVKSHFIEYKKAAVLNDIIEIKTHIKESKGALSIRIVEMFDKTSNELILKSKTEWVLLDAKSARPIRISDDIQMIFK